MMAESVIYYYRLCVSVVLLEIINEKFHYITSLILIVLMLMFYISINHIYVTAAESQTANTLWIEPATITINRSSVNVGYRFNVTLWVNTTQQCFTWQLKLQFNSTYFEVTRFGYTAGDKSAFFADYVPLSVTPILNNTKGYILHGETLMGADQRDPGYGSLLWMELALKEIPPQKTFLISIAPPYGLNTFLLTSDQETIPLETGDSEITVVGLYTIVGGEVGHVPQVAWFTHTLVVVVGVILTLVALLIRRLKRHA